MLENGPWASSKVGAGAIGWAKANTKRVRRSTEPTPSWTTDRSCRPSILPSTEGLWPETALHGERFKCCASVFTLMSKRPAVVLLALLLCSLAGPMVVSAEQSGSIEASASTVTLQPSTPSAGDDLAITIAFRNTASQSAYTVEYFVYKDTVNADRLLEQGIINEIEADGMTSKTVYWNGLTEGQHRVGWPLSTTATPVRPFPSLRGERSPDLRATGAELAGASSLKTGDTASVEVEVSNVGSEPAAASVLGVALNGVAMDNLAVVALDAGTSANVTVNLIAPPTGEYVLRFTPDAEDAVVESQEENQDYDFAFTVHPRMDLRHKGAPSVSVVEGALNGPWTVSGEIERFDGDGTIEVPMRLEVPNDDGGNLMLGSFSVTVAGQGMPQPPGRRRLIPTMWLASSGSLARWSRSSILLAPPFCAGITTNDRSPAGNLDLLPIPDVQLDPPIPNPSEPESGEAVQWSVFIQNVGEIPVRGTLEYSFEGIEYEDRSSSMQRKGSSGVLRTPCRRRLVSTRRNSPHATCPTPTHGITIRTTAVSRCPLRFKHRSGWNGTRQPSNWSTPIRRLHRHPHAGADVHDVHRRHLHRNRPGELHL